MATEPLKRKLVTILATDAVGYSRHMAADEEGTMKILAAHRAVIDGIIEFHEGRILGTAGDSVLAEFASPVQAVRCAVEIQDALRTRNDSLPEERRLLFRIGINLGDVMVKGNDLLGDGVNVAARLESIAEPGGICISSSVYDQISGKLDLGFVDEGRQSLKNIDRPVRTYRVERAADSRRSRTRAKAGARLRWLAGAALAAVLAAAMWQLVFAPLQEKARDAEAQAKTAAEERARAEALARKREEALERMTDAQAAAAEKSKRAVESQLAAAELAQARSEADRLRREVAAERAAAEARRKTQALAAGTPAPVATLPADSAAVRAPDADPAASLREGRWTATVSCPPIDEFPARVLAMPVAADSDAYVLEHGASSTPGSLALKGRQDADGTLRFRGAGISGVRGGSKPYPAGFRAKPVGDRYEGAGRLGRRECTLVIARAR